MAETFARHLRFNSVMNFRDIGGYQGHGGKAVVWRRIFRSAEFRNITPEDLKRLTGELGVNFILDLRSSDELKKNGNGLVTGCGVKYCNIAFMTDDNGNPEENAKRFKNIGNLGDFYLVLLRDKEFGTKLVEALQTIAEPANHPLVFHCAVGKDRTGLLAAMLLKLLGVKENDIIQDYILSEPYMDEMLAKIKADPKKGEGVPDIPEYFWKASAASMQKVLDTLNKDYGSVERYLAGMSMDAALPQHLQKLLLS
jgi:protein-tyrosine phosphatase